MDIENCTCSSLAKRGSSLFTDIFLFSVSVKLDEEGLRLLLPDSASASPIKIHKERLTKLPIALTTFIHKCFYLIDNLF